MDMHKRRRGSVRLLAVSGLSVASDSVGILGVNYENSTGQKDTQPPETVQQRETMGSHATVESWDNGVDDDH